MSQNNLRARIAAGEELVALRADLDWSKDQLAAAWGRGKYDFVWLDGQHGPYSDHTLIAFTAAAEQLEGTVIRQGMGTTTTPDERQKYRDLGVTIFMAA